MKGTILIVCGLLLASHLFAQQVVIKGTVVDASTNEVIPYANVFINRSTLSTSTDENGYFELPDVPEGTYNLIVHYPGFRMANLPINTAINNLSIGTIALELRDIQSPKNDPLGSKNSGWQNHYKDFKDIFLTKSDVAKQCEILNPYVLNFSKEGGVLTATSIEAIEVSNLYLGYKISFFLETFRVDRNTSNVTGYLKFDEISTKGGATALGWMENRKNEFSGSLQHFFKSILNNQINKEEFYLYAAGADAADLSEKKSNFFEQLGTSITPYDTSSLISPGNDPNTFKVNIRGNLEVHHRGSLSDAKHYSDVPYAVSRITSKNGFALVDINGFILNEEDLLVEGDMEKSLLIKQLPFNYKVEKVVTVKKVTKRVRADRVQEKIYIHSDKPYYYPGEMVWLKTYINYRYPQLRDSISKTLYVEFINPQHKIVRSQILRIDRGFARGNFIVPDTVSHGSYYLRAYTNLNRNFGDEELFIKPISVLAMTEQVELDQEAPLPTNNNSIIISSNKRTYRTREKITLDFQVKDEDGNPVKSNLSVSVTDAKQVLPVKDAMTITEGYQFSESPPTFYFDEIKYPVEHGVDFKAQFLDKKGRPEKATVSVLQGDFENLTVIETDKDGTFQVSGLHFYDTTEFHFQAKDSKNRPFGRVELDEREIPSLDFEEPEYDLNIINTNKSQRLISEYEVPRGARLLQEILIKGRRKEQKKLRPYGNPDYVIKTDDLDISTNNLMLILQGKIPGLVVRTVSDSTGVHKMVRIVRATGLTILGPTEPLVMIDDAPMSGVAGDILESINAYTIESIEVITRVNPALGSLGANGVISIYTRKGLSPDYIPPTRPMQVIKIRGYATPRNFRYPNYGNAKTDRTQIDYRSIIYWNPDLITNESGVSSVSLYAADLQTQYRVVVEGVTENNKPVRGVYYLKIDNND